MAMLHGAVQDKQSTGLVRSFANDNSSLTTFGIAFTSHMWFNISSSIGRKDGSRGRDEVAKIMTAQQFAEAQSMVRECVNSGHKKCG